MTTYTLFRLSDRQAQKELATQRRYMQRHRAELADTRNPDTLRRYMEFATRRRQKPTMFFVM